MPISPAASYISGPFHQHIASTLLTTRITDYHCTLDNVLKYISGNTGTGKYIIVIVIARHK